MNLLFITSDLEAAAQSYSRMQTIFGTSAPIACQRLYELEAVDSLLIAFQLPTLDLQYDKRRRRYSISVCPAHRISFRPFHKIDVDEEVDRKVLDAITSVRILTLGGKT